MKTKDLNAIPINAGTCPKESEILKKEMCEDCSFFHGEFDKKPTIWCGYPTNKKTEKPKDNGF